MLCEACERTILQPKFGSHTVHLPSYHALRTSALGGCDLCRLLHSCVLAVTKDQWDLSQDDAAKLHLENDDFDVSSAAPNSGFNVWLTKETFADRSILTDGGYDFFSYTRNLSAGSGRLLSRHELSELRPSLAIRLKVDLTRGSIPFLIGRQVPSAIDLRVCRTWFSACTTSHHNCDRLLPRPLPTRLIDLTGREPKLILPHGRHGIYATLSHCWGTTTTGFRLPVTTSRNIESRFQCIPLDSMPRLFRDVISIVRALGFSMIWIDCLCIIQDDERDWQTECSRMATIYMNSGLTIAGPGAQDASCALLKQRSNTGLQTPEMQIQTSFSYANELSTIVVRQMRDSQSEPRYSERREFPDPLSLRGWAVQERLLASRILYVGSEQMYMECSSASCFEDVRHALQAHPMKQILDRSASVDQMMSIWYHVVTHYSDCNLTNGSDKLPALSGLASIIAHRTGASYLAGVWDHELGRGLTWSRIHFRDQQKNSARSFYPATQALPSWSWASCDRSVAYQPYARPFRSFVESARVNISVHGEDPYGQVDRGVLRMVARTKHAKLSFIRSESDELSFNDLQLTDNARSHAVGRVTLDKISSRAEAQDLWLGRDVTCVLIGQYGLNEQYHHKTWVALVLERCQEQPESFRRTGRASGGWDDTTTQIDWFDDGTLECISIV